MRKLKSGRLTHTDPLSGLTRRQRDVFEFICRFRLEHGASPTYEEIAAHLRVKSLNSVLRAVRALAARGAILHPRGKRRSIVPLGRDAITIALPDELNRAVRLIAEGAHTTPEAIVFEAVRARLSQVCESLQEAGSQEKTTNMVSE